MARWIITDCRKLTESEMAAILRFHAVDTTYGRSIEFDILTRENLRAYSLYYKIYLHSLSNPEDFTNLREIRIVTLKSYYENHPIYRVTTEDLPIGDWDKHVKEAEAEINRAKAYKGIFHNLIKY